ncbi:MAG: hypothetical protein LBT02_04305 [Rickettsiales bacterium]|jgi:5-formyltetrahydrofolate cyclo-ligase|nr:hypothetical protein [Rickettsiales bacterium]
MINKKEIRTIYKKTKYSKKITINSPDFGMSQKIILGGYKIIDNREIEIHSTIHKILIPKIISDTEMVYEIDGKKTFPSIIFVPCRGLDLFGNRVGSGKGYFDRYFASVPHKDIIKIGIVRNEFLQKFDEIENEKHDVKMNYILSEDGLLQKVIT